MIDTYLNVIQEELDSYIQNIDFTKIEAATDLILNSEKKGGRVHVTGIGKPSYVAGYCASLLSSTGTPAYVLHGTEAVHGSSGQVKENDVVIAISNSGETQELKATVQTLLKNNAIIVACTSNETSWLAKNASVCLLAKAQEEGGPLNKAPRASILMEMIVLQALSVNLQEKKNLCIEQYVKYHPGGSLGNLCREEMNNK